MEKASPVAALPAINFFRFNPPEWLIRMSILFMILPPMLLLGISVASVNAATGHYGMTNADAQYSMVIFYAALASFFPFEKRFFQYFPSKTYFFICVITQIITSWICYETTSLLLLFICRFIQGAANCGTISVCITMIFSRLHTERSREIGYSLFYGILLCITPVTTIFTAPMLDNSNYVIIYKAVMFAYIPGCLLLLIFMKNFRATKKLPLYQLDLPGFLLYSTALCLIGFVLVYGQEREWFSDPYILSATILMFFLLLASYLRNVRLRRPLLNTGVFKYKNFYLGMFLVLILYICRGAFGISSQYLAGSLGLDPLHLSEVLVWNIAGITLGSLLSSRLVLLHIPMRLIWMAGFAMLLVYHVWMCFLISVQVDQNVFYIPFLLQGMGVGMLLTPLILFMISSVPSKMSTTASAIGVFVRFTGFCISIALINYSQLKLGDSHYDRLQQEVTVTNPEALNRLQVYQLSLTSKGVPADQAKKIADMQLSKALSAQSQLRFYLDYYQLISYMLAAVLLILSFIPYINRTTIKVLYSQPAAVSY